MIYLIQSLVRGEKSKMIKPKNVGTVGEKVVIVWETHTDHWMLDHYMSCPWCGKQTLWERTNDPERVRICLSCETAFTLNIDYNCTTQPVKLIREELERTDGNT